MPFFFVEMAAMKKMINNTDYSNLFAFLKEQLNKELPGFKAQEKMSPPHRRDLIEASSNRHDAKPGSVMIILFPKNDTWHVVFTKRVEYKGVHSGQVSFPGGKPEKDDKDLIQTAIRETFEETGILLNTNNVIGKLTDLYVPPSNFLISAFVSVLPEEPVFVPDPQEVSSIFAPPLSHFADASSIEYRNYLLADGSEVAIPGYVYLEYFIWGATAMIFSEFLEL